MLKDREEQLTSDKQAVRPVSLKKLKANRRNALQTKGPKTAKGKKAVRYNALKHGLLAEEVLILGGEGKERAADFKALLASLRSDLNPEGTLEEMLVEKIAVCYWRLRRVLRAEIGAIREGLDHSTLDYQEAREEEIRKLSSAKQGRDLELKKTIAGLQFLLDELNDIREELNSSGEMSELVDAKLSEYFGQLPGSLTGRFRKLAPLEFKNSDPLHDLLGAYHPSAEPRKLTESNKAQAFAIIDEEKRDIEKLRIAVREREQQELELRRACLQIPPKETMEKILRYETAIERQLYRAMDQLERLQRRRGGEIVPPPINVKVSSEN